MASAKMVVTISLSKAATHYVCHRCGDLILPGERHVTGHASLKGETKNAHFHMACRPRLKTVFEDAVALPGHHNVIDITEHRRIAHG